MPPPRSVLMLGLVPELADLSAFPGMTPEKIHAGISAQLEAISTAGYDVHNCFIDRGETAEQVIADALSKHHVDCVMIGAGVRVPPTMLVLFEKVLNVVHQHAPHAKICFNTNPTDSLVAVQRWLLATRSRARSIRAHDPSAKRRSRTHDRRRPRSSPQNH